MNFDADPLEILEETVNFLRGMTLDPRLPHDMQAAISARVITTENYMRQIHSDEEG